MAFPAVTPTSAPQASSLHSNNAANAGLTNAIPVDRLTSLEQTVGNLLTDLPGAINAIVTTGTLGYGTGGGGTVTQATNRTTGVTLSKLTGQITTNNASLAAEAAAEFTVTNTLVAIGDVVVCCQQSGSNGGDTDVYVSGTAAGSFKIKVANNNAAAGTAETGAIIINFAVIKGASA